MPRNEEPKNNDITVLIFPEDDSIYLELNTFINFLRDPKNTKPEDSVYNSGLIAIAKFLEEKKPEFLKQRDEFQSVFGEAEEKPERLN